MAAQELFEPFETVIADVSQPGGMGYIQARNTLIKVGAVNCPAGTEIKAILHSKWNAVCLTRSVVADSYSEYLGRMTEQYDLRTELDGHGLSPGDEFVATVKEVRGDQVGVVEDRVGDRILIGPVICDAGRRVDLEYVGNGFAYCLDKDLRAENHVVRLNILAENFEAVPLEVGEEYVRRVVRSFSDNSVVEVDGTHVNLPNSDLTVEETVQIRVTGFASQSASGELIERVDESSAKDSEMRSRSEEQLGMEESGGETDSRKIETLRKQAKETSSTSVFIDYSESVTRQYSRSDAVKDYAKARAGGVCEGCESPAPFENTEEEPYLHVHHLEELSDGGDDAPENVACLCPNCHSRIHHGKDGEEYNSRLKTRIQEKES